MKSTADQFASFSLDKLPHAILFTSGNTPMAETLLRPFAARLLCLQQSEQACGHCQSCKLFQAGAHPDYRQLPMDGKEKIAIDDVRDLIEFIATRPKISASQITLLSPADSMNMQAANALLKILEEPPPESYLFLIAELPTALPITVRSRCMKWHLKDVPAKVDEELRSKLCQMLSQSDGIAVIAQLKGFSPIETLNQCWGLVGDIIRFKQAGPEGLAHGLPWQAMSDAWTLPQLWTLHQKIIAQLSKLLQGYNVNTQLFLEQLILSLANQTSLHVDS